MKKTYALDNLDCANCVAKMEAAIAKIDGVQSATISFMAQKLTLEADEDKLEAIVEQAKKCVSNVDRHCTLIA